MSDQTSPLSNHSQAERASYKPWQERALAGVLGAAAAASILFAGPAEAAVQPFLSSTGKLRQKFPLCPAVSATLAPGSCVS